MVAQNRQFRFTKSSLSALEPSAKPQEYRDDKARGLRLRVTVAGTKSFYLLRKIKGNSERVFIGRFPDTTIEQARRRVRDLHAAIDSGENPNQIKRAKREESTLNEFFDLYDQAHLAPSTRNPANTRMIYDLYLRAKFGRKKLSSIEKADIQKHQRELHAKSGYTAANKMLTLLRALYNKAVEYGYWSGEAPSSGLRKYAEPARDRLLHPEELKRLLAALGDPGFAKYRDFFLLLLLTGARRRNVQSMQWSQINLDARLWLIPVTKSGRPQTVALVDQAVWLLRSRKQKQDVDEQYVFPAASKSGHLEEPKKVWRHLLERADIQDLRMHDLRHAFGSLLAASGSNQFVIKAALGHRDISTSDRYVQISPDVIRSSVATVADQILDGFEELLHNRGEG